jgi:hypothetical protein
MHQQTKGGLAFRPLSLAGAKTKKPLGSWLFTLHRAPFEVKSQGRRAWVVIRGATHDKETVPSLERYSPVFALGFLGSETQLFHTFFILARKKHLTFPLSA